MKDKEKLIIYKDKSGEMNLEVSVKEDTVWLTLDQMSTLFKRDKSVVSRHIKNIFAEKELKRDSVVAKNATTAPDGKTYMVDYYNLDVIISVGYRVKSKQGTQFRIWANKVLKKYLLEGYVVNEKLLIESRNKLKELQETVHFVSESAKDDSLLGQERELFSVLDYYSTSISLLGKYDSGKLRKPKGKLPSYDISYSDAGSVVVKLKKELTKNREASSLFGNEIEGRFKSIMGAIYQTFDGEELYKSIEEKAANLLYLLTKDHPFSDGNKRIASILFVYFLEKNGYLFRASGERKISDNTLVTLVILTASSSPNDKDILIRLISNLIKG